VIQFLTRRLAQAIPLLFVISLLAFVLIHAAPGGPLAVYLSNPSVRPQDIERLRHALGLDRSLWSQYWSWLAAFVQGNWGYSFSDGRPVAARIAERLPATLELASAGIVVALIFAIPAGVVAAVRRGRATDHAITAAATAGISLPAFWFGLVLQIVFAVALGWLPSSGRTAPGSDGLVDHLQHLVLPTLVLACIQAAAWSRYLRGSMIEALAQPTMITARARGVPEARVVMSHAFRNALGPFVSVVTIDAALLVSGAVVTESVFAWPGLGSLFTEALGRRDYAVLMTLLVLSSAAVVVLNVVADFAQAAVDPRVTIE
jgi:peptide/nickel transport system permease protein